jgi:hypothetical protein
MDDTTPKLVLAGRLANAAAEIVHAKLGDPCLATKTHRLKQALGDYDRSIHLQDPDRPIIDISYCPMCGAVLELWTDTTHLDPESCATEIDLHCSNGRCDYALNVWRQRLKEEDNAT